MRKSYGALQALDGVDLTVRRGELLALLGPNGAGKTTLVEILEGHRRADAGDVRVLGHDPARARARVPRRIGIVLQEEGLDPNITVREAVELYGAAYPDPRPRGRGARRWSVWPTAATPAPASSRAASAGGWTSRSASSGDPELIFLDEPTTGFDPGARRRSWELIDRLRSLGKTIVLTTHYMEEAQRARRPRRGARRRPRDRRGHARHARRRGRRRGDRALPRRTAARDASRPPPRRATSRRCSPAPAERGEELEELTVTRPSLEDVYLQLTEEPA